MTETGIETADGVREFDIIVWATGFDFGTGALDAHGDPRPRRPRARGRTGPTARRRSSACRPRGFPNFFFPGGPHAAAGNNPRYNGDQVDFVTDTLVYARDHGYDAIEVTPRPRSGGPTWSTRARRRHAVRREQLLLRHQHPGQAAQVPAQLGRPAQALQMIAEVRENDYEAFKLSRSSSASRSRSA